MSTENLISDTSADSTASPPTEETEPPRRSGWSRLTAMTTVYLGLALVLLIVAFSIAKPDAFLSAFNIRSVFTDASVLLIVAVGATYVIATAGIDLSVGSVLVFSGVVSLKTMK